jgi:mRNA interferase RelE/StbE
VQNSVQNRYCVNINRHASREITRLPKVISSKILNKISKLNQNPFPRGCKKVSNLENDYRLRQGDYRILYVVDSSSLAITVVATVHRKAAYANLQSL